MAAENTFCPWQSILHTNCSSHKSEAHDRVRDVEGEADDGHHPDKNVAVQANPEDRNDKAQHEVSLIFFVSTIWDGVDCHISKKVISNLIHCPFQVIKRRLDV